MRAERRLNIAVPNSPAVLKQRRIGSTIKQPLCIIRAGAPRRLLVNSLLCSDMSSHRELNNPASHLLSPAPFTCL
ncbi:hypothetical protein EYF80_038354 [Liparis tanakae]|uniref:Uncharacterized protein n=1 Tax=Liparis tanakae TaxID=230148 RepID=A0A4Z2GFK8_9TELE|nr:hypothetical protein EYF80_038354 [Liparis tanakae]